jgi:arginase
MKEESSTTRNLPCVVRVSPGTLRERVVIEAPSNLGLKPPRPGVEPGVRRLPEALVEAGLLQSLGVLRRARVEAPPYVAAVDPETGIRNAPAIARYSVEVAEVVGCALDARTFPIVLGGDCSILLGNLLALRRRGRFGLFFLDGHADFATPETSPSQAAAGMDLSLATGRGPVSLSNLAGLAPLVRDEDVVLMGYRDEEALPGPMAAHRIASLRRLGMAEAARQEVARLRSQQALGFWIHVDADVLDPSVMPAVDTPEPNGLTLPELTDLLRELLASPLAAGMQLCIYDPDLDPSGECARRLVDILAAAFPIVPGEGW